MPNINDLSEMEDVELQQYRTEVNAYADQRLAAQQLRNETRDLAIKARDLGRTPQEVGVIIQSVLAEVYSPEPTPAPDETPVPVEEGDPT